MPVEFRVLGSGTMLPDSARHSASHYLEGQGAKILFDCGPGTFHSLDTLGVPWADLTHVALTHFHTDHIGDVPGLFFALKYGLGGSRSAPLTVLGPPGLYQRFGHLASAFGDHILDPGFEVLLVELTSGDRWAAPDGRFVLGAHTTPHTEASLAYRWEGEGVVVGYTGDTGPSMEVARFLAGCDLVVAECAFEDPPPNSVHLSPQGLADMADAMDPALLLITHVYPPQTSNAAARGVREAGWTGRVEAAEDGTVVRLGSGPPALQHPGTPTSDQGPHTPAGG